MRLFFHFFFFFNDTATTEIYTLSLHDALPIYLRLDALGFAPIGQVVEGLEVADGLYGQYGERPSQDSIRLQGDARSEEHTSELQSRPHLVCRLLLEKKKNRRVARALALEYCRR